MIKEKIQIPKYLQIVNDIKEQVLKKDLVISSSLPSIRQVSKEYNMSQETVVKAYNELKKIGVIKSAPRQGYFIASDKIDRKQNIFLLFDELSEYKKTLYNAIRDGFDAKDTKIDIYFHHCNSELFNSFISEQVANYNYFVVMSFNDEKIKPALSKLHGKNVLFIDRKEQTNEVQTNFIVQEFNNSVYDCLILMLDRIKKYEQFILVFPNTTSIASNASKAPQEIKLGFTRFCTKNNINYQIIEQVQKVNAKDCYFVIDDMDLVNIITKGNEKGYQLGADIGLVSYNDTPLKSVIAEGITTISIDYKLLGDKIVSCILNGTKKIKEIIKTDLILRKSL